MFGIQKTTLKDAAALHLLDGEARGFTEATLRFYRTRIGAFVRWCAALEDAPTLDTLTPHHIRRYLVELSRRGLSSAYVHQNARAIKAFLNYCVRDELLAVSPFARVVMPRLEKKILPTLTPAEVRRVVAACLTERDRAAVLFFLDSGVRASELCGLDVADVDLESGAVAVRQGKGQKDRATYIGPKTRKQVLRYLRLERGETDSPALFVSQKNGPGGFGVGERLTYYGVAQLMRRLRLRADVPHLTAHAMRRTFAINCLRGGMNVYVLAKLMGHADIHVLRQYLALVEDDLAAAHKAAAVVDRMLGGRGRGPPGRR